MSASWAVVTDGAQAHPKDPVTAREAARQKLPNTKLQLQLCQFSVFAWPCFWGQPELNQGSCCARATSSSPTALQQPSVPSPRALAPWPRHHCSVWAYIWGSALFRSFFQIFLPNSHPSWMWMNFRSQLWMLPWQGRRANAKIVLSGSP